MTLQAQKNLDYLIENNRGLVEKCNLSKTGFYAIYNRECQHIPQILPIIYRKNIYAQMRVFLTFFYLLHGVKDLPEIYRWLNLVKSIFSNFFGQKTIFEPSLSLSQP